MAAGSSSDRWLREGGEGEKQVTCLPGDGQSAGAKGETLGPGGAGGAWLRVRALHVGLCGLGPCPVPAPQLRPPLGRGVCRARAAGRCPARSGEAFRPVRAPAEGAAVRSAPVPHGRPLGTREPRGVSAGYSCDRRTAVCLEGEGHAAESWAVKRGTCVSASAGAPGALLVKRV